MPIAPDSEKREKIFRYFMLAFLSAILLMFFWGLVTELPGRFYRRILPIFVWGIMGAFTYRGVYSRRNVYTFGICFLAWYYITRCLNGDAYLSVSFNWVIEFCLVYGVVFPFAYAIGDSEKRHVLDIALLICVVSLLFMAIPGIICAITGETIVHPLLGVETAMNRGRLNAMSQISNGVAVIMNIGLFVTCYLLAAHWNRWTCVPGILAIVIFFAAGSLTSSRGALFGRAVALAVIACVFVGKIPLKKKWLHALLLTVVFVAGTLIGYKATDVAVDVISRISHVVTTADAAEESGDAAVAEEAAAEDDTEIESVAVHRKLSTGIGTLNGRLNIYKEVLSALREQPSVLWKGMLDNDVMQLAGRYQAWHYLHNSFLQTLAQTGVLGLLFALAFCVIFFVNAMKILLDKTKTMGQKMLPIIMIPLILHGFLESFLFVTWRQLTTSSFVNIFFFLCAGYTMEMAKGTRFKDLFSKEN